MKPIIGWYEHTHILWRKLAGDSKTAKFVNVFSPSKVLRYMVVPHEHTLGPSYIVSTGKHWLKQL